MGRRKKFGSVSKKVHKSVRDLLLNELCFAISEDCQDSMSRVDERIRDDVTERLRYSVIESTIIDAVETHLKEIL